MSNKNKSVEEVVASVMKSIETEVVYDATQWNNMLVWEAGDYDIVFDIIKHAIQQERQTSQEREREIVENHKKVLSNVLAILNDGFPMTAIKALEQEITNPNKD